MKKILIISTFYYPVQHIATNRIVAFAKYLKEYGYDVTVLTKGSKYEDKVIDGINVHYVNDTYFIKKLDTSKKEKKVIHYLKCVWNIAYMNIYNDEDYGWTKNAVKKVNELLKQNHFYFVLSSAPPIGPHIVAYEIKKKYPKIKWIVDMRDALWSPNYPSNMRKNLIKFIKNIISKGDILLSVSKPQLEEYINLTSNKLRYLELRNGYDFEYIESNKEKNNKFIIMYTGNFYTGRKPDNFFEAVKLLVKNDKINNFAIEIIGNSAPINIPGEIRNYIKIITKMPYNELISYVREKADLLLMISPSDIEKGCYTGKLFDYVGIGKPILGLVPKDDVAADLIKETHIGYIAENENIKDIETVLKSAYEDWMQNKKFTPNYQLIKQHQRKAQVKYLAQDLEDL